MTVKIIGAGLAGCEAALAVAKRGINAELYEMKPAKYSPAHKYEGFAELVCSNSLKAERLGSAAGLLKREMAMLGSVVVEAAYKTRVEAGGALAVDRKLFSDEITKRIYEEKLIKVINEEQTEIDWENGITIVATGPLTAGKLAEDIFGRLGSPLSFYDAAAPVITGESVDYDRVFMASRYDRGGEDYINCPFNKDEYEVFWRELVNAERAPLKDFDNPDYKVYEGCMPVEVLASRGIDTLRFGPLKPKGLKDPKDGKRPWAVVQLRKEDREGIMYNLVGFQTNLKFGEQKRVFSMIPGLENAEFVRYGVMHRNSFIDSPRLLNKDYSLKNYPNVFFAGQITGVEGYIESAASGIIAGINAARRAEGKIPFELPRDTMTGALTEYICDESIKDFQPMGCAMGLLPDIGEKIRDKNERYERYSERALKSMEEAVNRNEVR